MQLACVPLMPTGFVFVISHLPSTCPCISQSRAPVNFPWSLRQWIGCRRGSWGKEWERRYGQTAASQIALIQQLLYQPHPHWGAYGHWFWHPLKILWCRSGRGLSFICFPGCYCLYPCIQYPCESMSFKIITLVILQ